MANFFNFFKRPKKEAAAIEIDETKVITIEQYEKIRKERTKEVWNQVTRVLGVLVFLFLVIIIVCMLYVLGIDPEGVGGILNGKLGEHGMQWIVDILNNSTNTGLGWVITIFFWMVIVSLVGSAIYLATFNIIDLIGVVKGLLRLGKTTASTIGSNISDTVVEGIGLDKEAITEARKKRLFTEEEEKAAKPEPAPKATKKPATKKKSETVDKKTTKKPVAKKKATKKTEPKKKEEEKPEVVRSESSPLEASCISNSSVENLEVENLTEEQLDALLTGQPIEVAPDAPKTRSLFEE